MKINFATLFLLISALLASAQITVVTNYPTVTLTAQPPNNFYVNGSPVGADGFQYVEAQIQSILANPPTYGVSVSSTNLVLASKYLTLLNSNNFVFTGSNYLGSFPNLASWTINPPNVGGGGLSLPTNAIENLYGSTNGGTSWFIITNQTPIAITVLLSVVGDSNSAPGSILLQALDHPELAGHVITYDGQITSVADATGPKDAVNLETLNVILGNRLNGQFVGSMDTNNVPHSILAENGQTVIDIASPNSTLANNLSVSGTNLLLNIPVTNFITGWKITASTNLAQFYAWPVFTNYSISTNSGIVTFTIPKPAFTTYYFWPQGPALNRVTITPPLTLLAGTLYPSNPWSLYTVTNQMVNGEFWTGNSNGLALISLYLSNGVPFIKQLAP